MKTLVVYYSRTGNNRFLAEKIAKACGGDIEEIRPRAPGLLLLILASLLKLSAGNRALERKVGEYDAVVLCGPVWMGQLISPLRDFVTGNRAKIRKLYFATCCGCGDAEKDTKFGYTRVFALLRSALNGAFAGGTAFPIELIVPEELKGNSEAIMNIRLREDTFTGKILERYNQFIKQLA